MLADVERSIMANDDEISMLDDDERSMRIEDARSTHADHVKERSMVVYDSPRWSMVENDIDRAKR